MDAPIGGRRRSKAKPTTVPVDRGAGCGAVAAVLMDRPGLLGALNACGRSLPCLSLANGRSLLFPAMSHRAAGGVSSWCPATGHQGVAASRTSAGWGERLSSDETHAERDVEGRSPDQAAPHAVTVQRLPSCALVEARGPFGPVAAPAHRAVLQALAEEPTAVLCDLSRVTGPADADAVALVGSLGAQVRHWPGTPVGVVCPSADVRRRLLGHRDGQHLVLGPRRAAVLSHLAQSPPRTSIRQAFAPVAESVRAARDLVAHACLDWGCGAQADAAMLVASELVTNALIHAGTGPEMFMARSGSRLRLAVRDGNARRPQPRKVGPSSPNGRGMLLVAAMSRAWGVLPTTADGKVVWAVLDV